MQIYIGADHRGHGLKKKIVDFLKTEGHEVCDVGTHNGERSCDYPKYSQKVTQGVIKTKGSRGILVCMTGIGHTIAANKVPGIYAALCYNEKAAFFSRAHNNSNVLVFGAKFVSQKEIFKIIKIWMTTKFEGGRHARRVNQIKRLERKICK